MYRGEVLASTGFISPFDTASLISRDICAEFKLFTSKRSRRLAFVVSIAFLSFAADSDSLVSGNTPQKVVRISRKIRARTRRSSWPTLTPPLSAAFSGGGRFDGIGFAERGRRPLARLREPAEAVRASGLSCGRCKGTWRTGRRAPGSRTAGRGSRRCPGRGVIRRILKSCTGF